HLDLAGRERLNRVETHAVEVGDGVGWERLAGGDRRRRGRERIDGGRRGGLAAETLRAGIPREQGGRARDEHADGGSVSHRGNLRFRGSPTPGPRRARGRACGRGSGGAPPSPLRGRLRRRGPWS